MPDYKIIEDALKIIKDSNTSYSKNFRLAQTTNHIYDWFLSESSNTWIDDIIKKIDIDLSTQDDFKKSWVQFKDKFEKYKAISNLLSATVASRFTLFEIGKDDIYNLSQDEINKINTLLTYLMLYVGLILGIDLSSEFTKDDIDGALKDLAGDLPSSQSGGSKDSKTLSESKTVSGLNTSSFIAPPLSDPGFVLGKEYLILSFKKFINDTYVNYKNVKKIGGNTYPSVDSNALKRLVGGAESEKFRYFAQGQDIPVDFDIFWSNIDKKYSSSNTIKEILNTELSIKPIDLNQDQLEGNLLQYIIDNLNDDVAKTFKSKTNYNSSDIKNWWTSGISSALAQLSGPDSDTMINYYEKIDEYLKIPMFESLISTEQFKNAWELVWNMMKFINESNEKLSRNIWALRIDKNLRVSELKNYSFHRINQLNSNFDFRFEFNTPENYLYRFESSNFRTANSTRIRLIDLGKRSDDIEVESQRLKFAVERLFSTIKLIEYKKATQAENLGKSWQRLKDVFR